MSSSVQSTCIRIESASLYLYMKGVKKHTLHHPRLHARNSHNGRHSQRRNGGNCFMHGTIYQPRATMSAHSLHQTHINCTTQRTVHASMLAIHQHPIQARLRQESRDGRSWNHLPAAKSRLVRVKQRLERVTRLHCCLRASRRNSRSDIRHSGYFRLHS